MNSLRNKITNRKLVQNALLQVQSITTSPIASSEIQLPNRKERGPTDILKALESTIGRDFTAPHYKYIDDPFLIPVSNLEKRSYALARESGRKSAMWIRQEHAEFFQHKNAEPMIESYTPKAVYTDKNQVSEELLLNIIKSGNVDDSIQIYNLLECSVKIETKLALYEMLCFYNSKQPIDDELVEERWFSITGQFKDSIMWKEIPEQETLFKSLVKEGGKIATAAYNALICGSSKYNNMHRAWEVYQECQKKEIPLCKRTYDYLIPMINIMQQTDDGRTNLLIEILKEMAQKNLRPDVKTLNASLNVAMKMKENRKEIFVTLINEFLRINVKPSLTTYLYILDNFSHNREYAEKTLTEVLNELEGQNLELKDSRDIYFFVEAMRLAFECSSLVLGKRLHKLLLTNGNYHLIGDSYKENVYYRYYMLMHLDLLQFDSFMRVYEEFTPNIYTPEISVFMEILKVLKTQDPIVGRENLPTLFSQALIFDFMRNDDAVVDLLKLMTGHCKPPPESPLNATFAKNAWVAWNQIQDLKSVYRKNVNFLAAILENIAILCVRGDEFDQMLEVLSILINSKHLVIGSMSPDFVNEIADACMERGHTEAIMSLIEYAIEYGMDEGITAGVRAYNTLPFSDGQLRKLETLIGKDVLKVKSSDDVS